MLYAVPYDALLGLHLLAVATFLAGMLLVSALLPGFSHSPQAGLTATKREELARLRLIDRCMILPALLLLWLCGIGMVLQAGWYAAGWLHAKLACVAVLSAIHLGRSRKIAQLLRGETVRPAHYRMLWLILVLIVAIGTLVIAKPF
jgi:protoporphyrinogen IX oxidase